MTKINNKNLISYSLLAFCLSFIGLPIYIYLPNYYADNFGVTLQTMSLILLATRLLDTIQDPIFGIISDKFSPFKKNIICYFSPLLGISFLLLFYPLSKNIEIWLSVFLILTYSIFSIVYINYQSYAVSFSDDYHLKTKIISYREVSFILGVIFAAAAPAILFKYFSEIKSFLFIGLFFLFLITIFAIIFFFYAPKNTAEKNKSGGVKVILKNKSLRKYFIIFLLNAISSSIPAVLILFFVENVINAKNLTGLFLILYFTGLLFGVALWTKLSKFLNDKVKAFTISILFTVFIFFGCYFINEGDILFYAAICVLSGVGFGGDFALAYSILTDIIQKNKLQNFESTIFGITNFIIKISLTLSSAALIYCIGALENDFEAKKQFISFSYALLPIFFRLLSAVTLHFNKKIL
jgi:Na+/melibiose symporter-like transporter